MALAAGQDDVAGAGQAHGQAQGFPPVGHTEERGAFHPTPAAAALGHHLQNVIQALGARVLGGEHRQVGQLGGGLGHQPALFNVAPASRAKGRDHASARTPGGGLRLIVGQHLAGGFQRAAQGVGRVGKVHEGGEGLAQVQPLHAPRHPRQRGQAPLSRLGRQAERAHRSGEGGQAVGDVVGAHELSRHRDAEIRPHGRKGQPGRPVAHGAGVDFSRRAGVPAVTVGALVQNQLQVGQRAVIGVEHAGLGHADLGHAAELVGGGAQSFEEQALGGAVVLIGLVVVQVFVGDVGHHGHVKLAGRYPVLRQAVRGHLQHTVRQPGGHHARQVALHRRRIRRRHMEAGVQALIADHRADRRDQPRPQPGRQQNGMQQAGRGGLAIGAGDAEHHQPAGREAVEGGGEPGESGCGRVCECVSV